MAAPNKLFFGDNLGILKNDIDRESVDLIYLDPPFNSDRNYNVLFKEQSGEASPAQIEAFTDTWHWDLAARRTYDVLIMSAPDNVRSMLSALREFIGPKDVRDLIGTIQGKAEMGLLLSLEPITEPMKRAAVEAGSYFSTGWNRTYERIQLLTVGDLLAGKTPDLPPMRKTFQRAERFTAMTGEKQSGLFDE